MLEKSILRIAYPSDLNGVQLHIPDIQKISYNPIPLIPSFFWLSTVVYPTLPQLPDTRRALLYEILDLHHPHICTRKDFHIDLDDRCICKFCNKNAMHYHFRSCTILSKLTTCALMKTVFSTV